MKAKLRLANWNTNRYVGLKIDGGVVNGADIDLGLDETYWRNSFAKAAMGEMINMYWEELTPKGLAKECFDIAEAMVKEMRKREKETKA